MVRCSREGLMLNTVWKIWLGISVEGLGNGKIKSKTQFCSV